ncbi:MAG: hypothetical protein HUJ94_01700 [Bacteroidales bacterium]|nr:hypothetical protein [Bacteroidales bacterium]
MKKQIIFAFVAGALALAGCAKDQELYDKVDDLSNRVTTLEEQVKELNERTVPGMQAIVAALQGNVYVTSVQTTANGYSISFSNKVVANISNGKDGEDGAKGEKGDSPKVSIVKIDGEWYWAVDGKALTDNDGKNIPVYQAAPQFRINEGKWEISYDGKEWAVVPSMGEASGSAISIKDEDSKVTFYINGEAYEVLKEMPFFLVFEQRKDISISGSSAIIPYTIQGVSEGDEIEVDILSTTNGAVASVSSLPKGDSPGFIVVSLDTGKSAKVFVYASNGRGKTDIKSLSFVEGVFEAAVDALTVPSAGGNVTLTVKTNMDYDVNVKDGADWLSIVETKAVRTDVISLSAAANESGSFRTAEIEVVAKSGESSETFVLIQYPDETKTTDLSSLAALASGTSVSLSNISVMAVSNYSAILSDGVTSIYSVISDEIPCNSVINAKGTVLESEDGTLYFEVSSFELVSETTTVSDPDAEWYGFHSGDPLYTTVSGILTAEDGMYMIDTRTGMNIMFDDPVSSLGLSGMTSGDVVTVSGYIYMTVNMGDSWGQGMVVKSAKEVEIRENKGWTLSYDYDTVSNPEYPENITNTVSGTTSRYWISIYSEDKVKEYGSADEFVRNACVKEADYGVQSCLYFAELYPSLTVEQIFNILCDSKSRTDSFGPLDFGKYTAIAVGVGSDMQPNGEYQVLDFEKADPSTKAAYEDFLGNWNIGYTSVTFTKKVEGKSYNIEGLVPAWGSSDGGAAEAEYDSETGTFSIKEQTFAKASNTSEENILVSLCGVFTANSTQYLGYLINYDEAQTLCRGKLSNDGTIQLSAGYCEPKSQNFVGFRVRGVYSSDHLKGIVYDKELNAFPFNMTQADAEYFSWLGTYDLTTKSKTGEDLTLTVSLSQSEHAKSFVLNGLGTNDVLISWDAENKRPVARHVNYRTTTTYKYYVSGTTNDNYICTGDTGNNGAIANFVKADDGTISIESVVYKVSDSRPEVYAAKWGVRANKIADGKWYSFSDISDIYNHSTMVRHSAAPSSLNELRMVEENVLEEQHTSIGNKVARKAVPAAGLRSNRLIRL